MLHNTKKAIKFYRHYKPAGTKFHIQDAPLSCTQLLTNESVFTTKLIIIVIRLSLQCFYTERILAHFMQ